MPTISAAPPAVIQIVQETQRAEAGILVYRLRREFDVSAGPMHRHDELVLAVAVRDGVVFRVRVIRDVVGGKAADDATVAQVTKQYEHPAPGDVFHRPFDPLYAAEYTFEAMGPQTYAFASAMRDSSHGSGHFTVNGTNDVLTYEYSPYVMPQYASTGTIHDQRGHVLPNAWFLTREAHEYRGHYAIFGAHATVTITYDSFARYPDASAAAAALQAVPAG